MKILMIVESPAKSKTIEKYLKDIDTKNTYRVLASYGHVRDLEKKTLSIEIDNAFKCNYAVTDDKTDVVSRLRQAIKEVDQVLIASDPDREGESIAWHLVETLKLKKYKRIVFHEISKNAIKNAISNPGNVNMELVNAQQTRRIIDRIMGFKLSPLLWKQFRFADGNFKPLSAGRVQSACLKIIVEREREIEKHASKPFWQIKGEFQVAGKFNVNVDLVSSAKKQRELDVDADDGEERKNARGVVQFLTEKDVEKFLGNLAGKFTVSQVVCKDSIENPGIPYITSTLQQDAHNKLGFDIKNTMKLAQDLYEKGFITYMRTDSHNLSVDAVKSIHQFIAAKYSESLIHPREFDKKNKKNAQEAHEAIRPTSFDTDTSEIASALSHRHVKLYEMIFKRTVACQMKAAVYLSVTVCIVDSSFSNKVHFKGMLKALKFPGWLVLYDKSAEDVATLEGLSEQVGKQAKCVKGIQGPQAFTSASVSHFNESSMVRFLEKAGIGRPSTYASILGKLFDKEYITKGNITGVEKNVTNYEWSCAKKQVRKTIAKAVVGAENQKITPSDLGIKVCDYLVGHFDDVISESFTAKMEDHLDDIAQGDVQMLTVLNEFWKSLKPKVEDASSQLVGKQVSVEGTKNIIEVSGKSYIVRNAKYGPVIEHGDVGQKKFVNLTPYLKLANKSLQDVQSQDVELLVNLPRDLENARGYVLQYARYGFYVTNKSTKENYAIFPKWFYKRYGNKEIAINITRITGEDIANIAEMKSAAADQSKPKGPKARTRVSK
jgi:DNA topoisomerase I